MLGPHDTLTDLLVPVDSLAHYPGNARTHAEAVLRESLELNGQYRPVVVWSRNRQVLAGNGTLAAARDLGWTEIAATFVDVDEDAARRINLVDNRANDLAGYDEAALVGLLEGVGPDLTGTGYDQAALDELLARLAEPSAGLTDPDDVPEAPAEPKTRLGDLWQLGPHRLLCGDATRREDVGRLLDGARPGLMVTDPPYGVAWGGDKGKMSIHGDLTQAVIPVSFAIAVEHLDDNARVYLFGGSSNWGMYAGLFDAHLRMQVRPIVWVKETFVLRPNNYHSQFEMVYFGWKGHGGSAEFWFGDRKHSDVWQVSRDPIGERSHPTQKPVRVCAIPILNSCPSGGLVYEPFAGSGSTLIAAHGVGRVCHALELSPVFADVICRRWQRFTGEKPVLESSGEPHDFTA